MRTYYLFKLIRIRIELLIRCYKLHIDIEHERTNFAERNFIFKISLQ